MSPVFIATLSFIAGICLYEYLPQLSAETALVSMITMLIMTISLRNYKYISSLCILLFFISMGFAHTSHCSARLQRKSQSISEQLKSYTQWKVETLQVKKHTRKTSLLVKARSYMGKDISDLNLRFLLQVKNNTIPIQLGDHLSFKGRLIKIKRPRNKGLFDSQQYYYRKSIFHESWIDESDLSIENSDQNFLQKCRHSFREHLSKQIRDKDKKAVFLAMTLGDRTLLDKNNMAVFRNSGAMHLLAVSGLHVGIIFFITSFILRPLKNLPYSTYTINFIQLATLWYYANITGFQDSTVRAVIMISVYLFLKLIVKPSASFICLALSAFILLSINPYKIYDVGFQLSFLAALGILLFYPIFNSMLQFENAVSKYILGSSYISLSAQMTTWPIVVFYFNQFPVYFILSSLVGIPLAFITIALAIVGISFELLNIDIKIFSKLLNWITDQVLGMMLNSLSYISNLEGRLIENIYLSPSVLICYYVLILFLLLYFQSNKSKYLYALLTAVLVMFIVHKQHKLSTLNKIHIDVFAVKKQSLISICNQGHCFIYTSSKDNFDFWKGYIHKRLLALYCHTTSPIKVQNTLYLKFNHLNILLHPDWSCIDDTVQYDLTVFSNSKYKANQHDHFKLGQLVIDGLEPNLSETIKVDSHIHRVSRDGSYNTVFNEADH